MHEGADEAQGYSDTCRLLQEPPRYSRTTPWVKTMFTGVIAGTGGLLVRSGVFYVKWPTLCFHRLDNLDEIGEDEQGSIHLIKLDKMMESVDFPDTFQMVML